MRVLLSWLRELAPLEGDPDTLADTMSALGLAVEEVERVGAKVVAVLCIVDRLEGASENFAKEGLELRALYTADEFLKA